MASCFTLPAIQCIEELGGTAISVFHDRDGIRQLLRPWSVDIHRSLPRPQLLPPMTFTQRLFYSQHENRGYLHHLVRSQLRLIDPTFEKRYLMVKSVKALKTPEFHYRNIPDELREEGLLPK